MIDLLPSFENGFRVAIIGASGGIGGAIVDLLAQNPAAGAIHAFARTGTDNDFSNLSFAPIDILDEDSIRAAAEGVGDEPLHLVIMTTGLLHDRQSGILPEKTWKAMNPAAMAELFAVNATGPALVMKHFLPLLAKGRKSAFAAISARVGSISDNGLGGWYGYRASKAALNQLIKTASIELARKNPSALCVGLHPGTVATRLSEPFQKGVSREKLFAPAASARAMLLALDRLNPQDSGSLVAWDGKKIPF